jgi:hypothetical protein
MPAMKRVAPLVGLLALVGAVAPAAAHPSPFSYLDVRIQSAAIELVLVVHTFDVAHELGIAPSERVLEPMVLEPHRDTIVALLQQRLKIAVDGQPLTSVGWSPAVPIPERQSIRFQAHYDGGRAPGVVTVGGLLFPYDATHQTFINFYEDGTLGSQAILGKSHTQFEYFAGTRQGILAVIRKFVPSGIHHILIGPDHLLFLVGLLLVGGSLKRLLLVISAFTLAHSVTLSLAAMNIVTPPASIIEPAIALSIVYVGADNLMAGTGRDMRALIALAFGFIHGFGFANVLREMDLPGGALGWSLFSFNLGVEMGQVFVVVPVAAALMALRSRTEVVGRRLAFVGSLVVMAAGAYWFIQRVFFPGGMA